MKEKERVLIADDSEINRELLAAYLEDDYNPVTVENGQQVLEELEAHPETAILLLDLYMPVMDGFAVLKKLKDAGRLETLPVIVISGERSVEVEERAFNLGVMDFVHKPFEARLVCRRVDNAVEIYTSRKKLQEKVDEQTREIKEQYRLLEEKTLQLESTNRKIIDVLGTTVEFRHMDSYQHIRRVKAFTRALAQQVMTDWEEYHLTQADVDLIVDASSLHDIGKICIPDDVLMAPRRLTKEEFELMKTHTTRGGEILNRVEGIWDERFGKACYDICMYHHEKFDGRGYPEGLSGDDIPLSAQIVSVVDVFDALVCKRCYKAAIPKPEAIRMIKDGECGQFNPKLLESFDHCRATLEAIAETIIGEDENEEEA